jgi:hypothetical protein
VGMHSELLVVFVPPPVLLIITELLAASSFLDNSRFPSRGEWLRVHDIARCRQLLFQRDSFF